ncbi:MAG TPA: lysylphosphatidylglycerol synthase domain-containing protein [Acidimicrobiales bacterium]
MTRRRLAGASTAVGMLLAAVAVAFVVQRLASNWDDVTDALAGARPGWIAGAAVLAVAGMTAIAVPWRRALRAVGGDLDMGQVVARYYLGELGKYLPGGVWPVVGRGELARRAGVPRVAAYASVGLSLVALYLAAMLLAVAGTPAILGGQRGEDADRYLWILLLLPVGVGVLHHGVLDRLRRLGEKVLRRQLVAEIPPWRESLVLVACYLPSWLLVGTSTWAIARGLGQDVGWWDVAPAAVLSWIVGFLLVPVPGGVGVREAAFAAAAGALDPGVAAAVAVVARVLFVAADGGGALVASAWLARHPAPVAVAPGEAGEADEGAAADAPADAAAPAAEASALPPP